MNSAEALLVLGLTEAATRKEIQACIDEKQNALNIKVAYSENETITKAYKKKLRDILEASAVLLQSDEEESSSTDVRAAIVAKMSGQPGMEEPEVTSEQSIVDPPTPTPITTEPQQDDKPKSKLLTYVLATTILVLGGITVVMNYNFLPQVKSDDSIQQTAAVEKVRGEIGTYQRRLETASSDLINELKVLEQSNSIHKDPQYQWIKHAHDVLFKSSLVSELEGELRMGESLLQQQSFKQARVTFSKVKDQYIQLWQRYNAAVEFISLSKNVATSGSSWNSMQTEYKLTKPDEIILADQNLASANSAFDAGQFVSANQHIQEASANFQQAIQSARELIALIKQRREKAMLAEVESERIRLEKIETENLKIAKAAAVLEAEVMAEEEINRLDDLDKKRKADELAQQLVKEAEEKRLALLEEKRLNLTKKPNPIVSVQPDYPRQALLKEKEGWVELRFTIAIDGTPIDIELIDSLPRNIFNKAALKAFKQWKFEPYTEDGKAVEKVGVKYRIIFSLD